ncbi:MAG: NUDIX hydrolase [Bacteroidetes bacterium]|nr:NUDIX hydrolase [Bacteroidota bacterium]
MSLKIWKKKTETVLFRNPWWIYRKDEIELPGGKHGEYHYVHTNGSSMVIPVLTDGRIVLVRQYRYLNERVSLELPCGGVKDGHTYDETAKQELKEEAGFAARDIHLAGEFNPYNGVTDEICRVYIARGLVKVDPSPDETEEFEIEYLLPDEIDDSVANGTIWDGMTIASWNIAKSNLNK